MNGLPTTLWEWSLAGFFSLSLLFLNLGKICSLPCQTSKRPAEDEPASPGSMLLKTYDNFTAKFEFNKQRHEDLAVEEQNLKEEFESRLKELELRRAVVLADKHKELK